MRRPGSPRKAFTLVELLVVVAIFALSLGLLLAAIQMGREAAHRVQCLNNLKQIGLALNAFHDTYHRFPHAYDARALFRDPGQTPVMAHSDRVIVTQSWATLILPFLEHNNLAQTGSAVYSARYLPLYACPSDRRARELYPGNKEYGRQGLTDYLAVTGTMTFGGDPTSSLPRPKCDGVIYESSRTRIVDISDGTSNTVLVGERPPSPNLFWGWWTWSAFDASLGVRDTWAVFPTSGKQPFVYCPGLFPENYRPNTTNNCDTHHFWSLHPGGGNWLFADASVRFLPYACNAILPALATRSGGEIPTGLEY
jgi:prepilin-type N-terminal cleavage/methylation domain-containing protein/prepilin-type processing-associated H-X9-DG protein